MRQYFLFRVFIPWMSHALFVHVHFPLFSIWLTLKHWDTLSIAMKMHVLNHNNNNNNIINLCCVVWLPLADTCTYSSLIALFPTHYLKIKDWNILVSKSAIFFNVTLSSPVVDKLCFGWMYRLYLLGIKQAKPSSQQAADNIASHSRR
jgi:hypothetical protein